MAQLNTNIRGMNISYSLLNETGSETIVFLHGFTGSAKTWEPIMEQLPGDCCCIAVDLLGHGNSDTPNDPNRYHMKEQLVDLHQLFISLKVTDFTLVGYSMGGRIALAYALAYPDQVTSLVLESASPGLKTIEEQHVRIAADDKLAERIEKDGLESFIDFWQDIPLFDSQKKLPELQLKNIRMERLQHSPEGLSNSLRGIGTGRQPSYWSALEQLKLPVTLITGEYDHKFNKIAEEMKNSIENCEHIQVSDVGHAIHVENPVQFATIIKEQLKSYI